MFKLQPSDIPAAISNYMFLSVLPSQNVIDQLFLIAGTFVFGLIQKACFAWVDRKRENYKAKRNSKARKPHSITTKNIEDEKISEQVVSD